MFIKEKYKFTNIILFALFTITAFTIFTKLFTVFTTIPIGIVKGNCFRVGNPARAMDVINIKKMIRREKRDAEDQSCENSKMRDENIMCLLIITLEKGIYKSLLRPFYTA